MKKKEKIFDDRLQVILIKEHYFNHKSVEQLAQLFDISEIDIIMFFNSEEAITLHSYYKDLEKIDKVNTLDELKEHLSYKLKDFLNKSTPTEASGLVESFIKQIIALDQASKTRSKFIFGEDADFELLNEADDAPQLTLQYSETKLLTSHDIDEKNREALIEYNDKADQNISK